MFSRRSRCLENGFPFVLPSPSLKPKHFPVNKLTDYNVALTFHNWCQWHFDSSTYGPAESRRNVNLQFGKKLGEQPKQLGGRRRKPPTSQQKPTAQMLHTAKRKAHPQLDVPQQICTRKKSLRHPLSLRCLPTDSPHVANLGKVFPSRREMGHGIQSAQTIRLTSDVTGLGSCSNKESSIFPPMWSAVGKRLFFNTVLWSVFEFTFQGISAQNITDRSQIGSATRCAYHTPCIFPKLHLYWIP